MKPFLQTGEEFEHTKTLNFIYERLIEVHGENPNVDYMHKLKNVIMMVEDRESPCNKAVEKPKRMREEYVKVEFEKLSDAALAVDGGDIQFNKYGNQPIDGKALALHYYNTSELSFYRREEVEVSERDEFIEAYRRLREKFAVQHEYENFDEFMADSGEFKLVEGE